MAVRRRLIPAEFVPHLDAAVALHRPSQDVETRQLARHIVTVIEEQQG